MARFGSDLNRRLGTHTVALQDYGLDFYRGLHAAGAELEFAANGNVVLALTDSMLDTLSDGILNHPDVSPETTRVERDEVVELLRGTVDPAAVAGGVYMPEATRAPGRGGQGVPRSRRSRHRRDNPGHPRVHRRRRVYIGAVPEVDGLWALAGDGESGITHGPGMGRLVGDLITGRTPFTDPEPFRLDRVDLAAYPDEAAMVAAMAEDRIATTAQRG